MKEEFLHYVWKYRLFQAEKLCDAKGEPIEVISTGTYNRDSGPDFFNARIRYGETEWAGNVEIHIKASDFNLHGHNLDHAYDNVILHLVAEKDCTVKDASGREVLTAVLEFDSKVFDRYCEMVNNPVAIACSDFLPYPDHFLFRSWLLSLLTERIAQKSERLAHTLKETGEDWEETCYRTIATYFGFRVNRDPFSMLVAALPLKIIRKHIDDRNQVEALLFGVAGLLDEGLWREAINDDYYRLLLREYKVLSSKYSLKSIHGWLWKFNRLRPVNFPTVRISQFAGMLSVSQGLFSQILEADSLDRLRDLLNSSASEYWDTHYVFGRKAGDTVKRTGDAAIDLLLINAIIPLLFAYGNARSDSVIKERALEYMDSIPAEDNSVTREWIKAGAGCESASDSQALLHLMTGYCRKRRCLFCRVGAKIIASGESLLPHEKTVLDRFHGYI